MTKFALVCEFGNSVFESGEFICSREVWTIALKILYTPLGLHLYCFCIGPPSPACHLPPGNLRSKEQRVTSISWAGISRQIVHYKGDRLSFISMLKKKQKTNGCDIVALNSKSYVFAPTRVYNQVCSKYRHKRKRRGQSFCTYWNISHVRISYRDIESQRYTHKHTIKLNGGLTQHSHTKHFF